MNAIHKNVIIPEDHHLHLEMDVPADLPVGEAELTILLTPKRRTKTDSEAVVACLRQLAQRGNLSGIPDPADWQRNQRQDRPLPGRD